MEKEEERFLEFCGITASKRTLVKIKEKLNIINKFYKGNTNNFKLEDIHRFLSWVNKSDYAKGTKNDIIKVFKRFLKWKYPDWSKRFNDLKDCKMNGNAGRQIDKEDLLSQDEMLMIINAEESIKYKTILLLLQETACRPEEILKNLKWKDVNWNKGEIKLYSNKTDKTRFIPIKNSLAHLKRYREECFQLTPKADEQVFGMSDSALILHLKELEKKTKISKHLYPYLWRHSVLTRMIKTLSPKVYEMYSGHSLETGMGTYAHLDTDDLKNELNEKIYKIEELTKEEKEELKKVKEELKEFKETTHQALLKLQKDFENLTKGVLKQEILSELEKNAILKEVSKKLK